MDINKRILLAVVVVIVIIVIYAIFRSDNGVPIRYLRGADFVDDGESPELIGNKPTKH